MPDEAPPLFEMPAEPEPPKRGRGRPRKDAGGTSDQAPAGHTERAKKSYAGEWRELLLPINVLLLSFPLTRADALTPEEFQRAVELGDKAAQRYPRVRRFVARANSVSLAASVASLALAVGLRVALNHHLLPPGIAAALAQMQAAPDGAAAGPEPGFAAYGQPSPEPAGQAEYTSARTNGMPHAAPIFPPGGARGYGPVYPNGLVATPADGPIAETLRG